MVFVPRWSKFNRQPSGPVEVDWANEIASGLVFCFSAHSPRINLVTQKLSSGLGGGGVDFSPVNYSEYIGMGPGSIGSAWGLGRKWDMPSCPAISIVDLFIIDPSTNSYAKEISASNNSIGDIVTYSRIDSSGTATVYGFTTSAAGNTVTTANALDLRQLHLLTSVIRNDIPYAQLDSGQKTTGANVGTLRTIDAGSSITLTGANPYPSVTASYNCSVMSFVFNRDISSDEHKSLYQNPWQLFKPRRKYWTLANLAARYARPTSDLSTGAWTPSTGGSLFAMVDESTASDSDYISTTSASTCSLSLNGVTDPATSSGQVINYRAKNNGAGSLTVTLKQGTTTIATRTNSSLTSSYADYQISLTGAECDAITDYSALKIELTSS